MIAICYFIQLVNGHIRLIIRKQLRAIVAKPHRSRSQNLKEERVFIKFFNQIIYYTHR